MMLHSSCAPCSYTQYARRHHAPAYTYLPAARRHNTVLVRYREDKKHKEDAPREDEKHKEDTPREDKKRKDAPRPSHENTSVSAEDIFNAAAANMPEGAFAGRWERWQPPAEPGSASVVAPSSHRSGWTLLSSGQSVYLFERPAANSISVKVMEAADAVPVSMMEAAAVAAAPGLESGGAVAGGGHQHVPDVMRANNKFTVQDHFFRPHLPDTTMPGGDIGLRLWAPDGLGFAMAPTALPQDVLHTHAGPPERPIQPQPFIANLYIKHPSLEPGIGRRWGWNLQYGPSDLDAQQREVAALQHIHHTNLGLVKREQEGRGGGVDDDLLLRPGPHTKPPHGPKVLPTTIDAFMIDFGLHRSGSAVEFSYEDGQLQRRELSCHWQPSQPVRAVVCEVWYSSGAYTRAPLALQAELTAGRPVVIEAGALIYEHADALTAEVSHVVRWLLRYRAGDGQLETARMEVYGAGSNSR